MKCRKSMPTSVYIKYNYPRKRIRPVVKKQGEGVYETMGKITGETGFLPFSLIHWKKGKKR